MSIEKNSENPNHEDDFVVEDEIGDDQSSDGDEAPLKQTDEENLNEKSDHLSEDGLQLEDEIGAEDFSDEPLSAMILLEPDPAVGIPIEGKKKPGEQFDQNTDIPYYVLEKCDDTGDQNLIETTDEIVAVPVDVEVEAKAKEETHQNSEIEKNTTEMTMDDFEVVDEVEQDPAESADVEVKEESGGKSPEEKFVDVIRIDEVIHEIDSTSEEEPHTPPSMMKETLQSPKPKHSEDLMKIAAPEKKEKSSPPKRNEPLPEILHFVNSETNRVFDWRENTCFFCHACFEYFTSLMAWENHIVDICHKKNVNRWRSVNVLLKELCVYNTENQKRVQNYRGFTAGLDKVVELSLPKNQSIFVCSLCNFLSTEADYLAAHLSCFDHIENYMEHVSAHLFKPPTASSFPSSHKTNFRIVDPKVEKELQEEARNAVVRFGKGKIKTVKDTNVWKGHYSNLLTIDEERESFEHFAMQNQIDYVFNCLKVKELKIDILPLGWSSANKEYDSMSRERRQRMVGLNHLVEMWAPSRRVIAVWYCSLCDLLTTDYTKHCDADDHTLLYMETTYKEAYAKMLLDVDSVDQLKSLLKTARSKMAKFEERSGRVKFVVQIHKLREVDSFSVVNAQIAKQIVAANNLTFDVVVKNPEKFSLEEDYSAKRLESGTESRSSSVSSRSCSKKGQK